MCSATTRRAHDPGSNRDKRNRTHTPIHFRKWHAGLARVHTSSQPRPNPSTHAPLLPLQQQRATTKALRIHAAAPRRQPTHSAHEPGGKVPEQWSQHVSQTTTHTRTTRQRTTSTLLDSWRSARPHTAQVCLGQNHGSSFPGVMTPMHSTWYTCGYNMARTRNRSRGHSRPNTGPRSNTARSATQRTTNTTHNSSTFTTETVATR